MRDRGWDGLWVGTAPRAVLGEWFTAPSYGGGHGEALPLPETEVEKGAKRGSGKLATQSRNYLERVAADSGWRMGK